MRRSKQLTEMYKKFSSLMLEEREKVAHEIKEGLSLISRIFKSFHLYPIDNPAFLNFAKELCTHLDRVHTHIPSLPLEIRRTGFFVWGERIEMLSEDEKMLGDVLRGNGIRSISFKKGLEPDELMRFFAVVSKAVDYTGTDYDLVTLLFEEEFFHLSWITDVDQAENQHPFALHEFPDKKIVIEHEHPVETLEIVEIFSDIAHYMREMEKSEPAQKDDIEHVLAIFSGRILWLLITEKDENIRKQLLERQIFIIEKMLLTGHISFGNMLLQNLLTHASDIKKYGQELYTVLRNGMLTINSDSFVDAMFEVMPKVEHGELSAFSQFISLLSYAHFERIFKKVVNAESKEVRMAGLRGIADDFSDPEIAEKLLKDSDWRIVRNALHLLRDTANDEFVPLISDTLNHDVKQIRLEAVEVMSHFSGDVVIPILEKAVYSQYEEVRLAAFEKLLQIDSPQVRKACDRLLRRCMKHELSEEELFYFINGIVASDRRDLVDLIAPFLFNDDKRIRMKVYKIISESDNISALSRHIARKIAHDSFEDMSIDELKLFVSLIRSETVYEVLPQLKKLFLMKDSLFNKRNVREKKEIILTQIMTLHKNLAVARWFENALEEGDSETKEVITSLERGSDENRI